MTIRFGEFVFDSETRQLTRGEDAIHISPKAFDLLQILIEERPRAVSKRQLIDRLWPDVIVEEANVRNLIAEIRTAIGDDDSGSPVIRTVPRFGYAFAGASALTPRRRSMHSGERASGSLSTTADLRSWRSRPSR